MSPSLSSFFAGLTFDILAAWAGEGVFQRGLAYHKAGKARNIALTPGGCLLATVDGTRKYTTLLFQAEGGKLASECTCPYGARCKHAVALACASLALHGANTPIPLVAAHDRRLFDIDIAAFDDEMPQEEQGPSPQELEAALKKFSKDQLIALVIQATKLAPEVADLCVSGAEPKQQNPVALVKAARKAMHNALEEEPYWDRYHYQTYANYADYAPVRKNLEALRLAGFPAEVLELGFELLEDSRDQLEMGDDEGETRDRVAQCMDIVCQALRDVDWPVHKKLQWAVDAVTADEYEVCDCFWGILREKHPPEAWNPVADALSGLVVQHRGDKYARSSLVDLAVYALDEAGREAEVLALCKNEAVQSGEYLRLVNHLLAKGNDHEAEEWIHKGVAVMEQKKPYTAQQLRDCLLELRKKQNNWDAVLCMQTEDFVRHASLGKFKECRLSAEKLKVWPVLRPLLMDFLIEKKIPWDQGAWPCQNSGKVSQSESGKGPDFTTLIDLAIDEKKPEEVLKWYDLQCKTQRGHGYSADSVATAVQDFAPERAVALWKRLAEEQIALVKPRAYVGAARFLRKMGNAMNRHNMAAQWDAYIGSLHTEHRRKPRLIEVLNGLTIAEKQTVREDGPGKK